MQIICTPSTNRMSPGGYITINGKPQFDLQWLGFGLQGTTLYPKGEEGVTFKAGQDREFRAWVRDWYRRQTNKSE